MQGQALTEASEQNLAALRRSMAQSRGFALYLLLADGPARAELRARLEALSGAEGVPALRFLPEGEAGAQELLRLLASAGDEALPGVVIVDGDSMVAAETSILALNIMRDRLGQLVAGPLLLILAPRSEGALSEIAPDLFDSRVATYEVEPAPGRPTGAPLALRGEEVESSPAHTPLPEPEDLWEQEASPAPPPREELAKAWLHLALVREAQADETGAGAAAREFLRLDRRFSYPAIVSRALRIVAKADLGAGRLPDAERALRESLALAKEHHDERAIALTWGHLADVSHARGELDEALSILREEVLPVYERLGDARDLLVGRTTLAFLLLRRGHPEDRDHAAELLRLALHAAEAMRIPEAAKIRAIQQEYGL